MIQKKYLEIEAVFFILLGAAAGIIVLTVHNNTNYLAKAQSIQEMPQNFQTAPIATHPSLTSTPTSVPTQAPSSKPNPSQVKIAAFNPTISTTSQPSSDGTKKVVLKTSQNIDGNQTYEVSVDDGPVFFSKTLDAGGSINIPFNAWSPNNRYFFIEENNGSQTHVMVFKADGTSFSNGNAYLDLSGDFAKYAPNALFDQASGWAADNLIVILTKLDDGSEGTSYWYSVPDESVIPLSTRF